MGMQRLVSSVSKIRKSQNLLLYSLMAGMTIVILALTAALFAGSSTIRKPQPKSYKAPITSGSSRMDPKEVYVEKLTTDHEIQGKRLDAVEKLLETLIKINEGAGKAPQRIEQTMIMPGYPQHPQQTSPSLSPSGSVPKFQHTSLTGQPAAELRGDLQAVLGDEGHPSQDFITSSSNQPNPHAKGTGSSLKQDKAPRFRSKGIQRTSLMLANSKSNKNLKTADNTIPAGAFAGVVMVGGVDASTSIQASNDPRPVLLRVTDHGTLPRKFKSDLCGCHVLAACYGDISSERVYMRLEKLTCTERKTGEIVEMAVNGYVAGEDGRAGLRGIVVDRAGESMRNAAIGGFLSGMGNFLSQSHSPVTFSPANGLAQTNPMTNPDMLKFGAAKGASGALDKYAEFYIKRAEQMQPVIQVQAGRKVDIVFTQGVAFENSAARADMIRVNDQHRLSQIHNSSDTASKPVEAWVPNQTPLSEHGK
jgi:conjugal transfer pilus assembly protein TraB